ncbi:MAG: FAD-dependent protein [Myxococcota bacterium]
MLLVPNVTLRDGVDERRLVAEHLGVRPDRIRSAALVRRSLDARHRRQKWLGVYQVEVDDEAPILRRGIAGVRPWNERDDGRYGLAKPAMTVGPSTGPKSAIVVGTGPAGLFSALFLAEAGYRVTVLERGGPVEERVTAVNAQWRGKVPLDPENNLVFGEGGAGTFSDGKIYTRRRDGELGYIFRTLIEFGADAQAVQESWAHLGTDKIRAILPPFRERLWSLGADLRYHARVDALVVDGGRCRGVVLADGTVIEGSPVLVATGHSARDAVKMMLDAGAAGESRGIAIGARIEHPQTAIDAGRYGTDARGELPPATYRLAFHPDRGLPARTFCMCPGGMVVPASNHPERVVVNGMSFAARRGFWANSALIVEVGREVYGSDDPMAGFAWQDQIERAAWSAGGGGYVAPAQRVVDLLEGRGSADVPKTSYPHGVVATDLRDVLPAVITDGMAAALKVFERQLPGFASADGVLIAPETRTTSPIRFLRTERGESTTLPGLFPVGEGAGYAGGIVSSALDGLRAARAIVGSGGEESG